jgi:hypothetical protein
VVILKNDFGGESATLYTLFDIEDGYTVTDIEFFDDKELGICMQKDQGKYCKSYGTEGEF